MWSSPLARCILPGHTSGEQPVWHRLRHLSFALFLKCVLATPELPGLLTQSPYPHRTPIIIDRLWLVTYFFFTACARLFDLTPFLRQAAWTPPSRHWPPLTFGKNDLTLNADDYTFTGTDRP